MNGRILVSLLVVSGWALTPLPLLSAHTFPPVVTQKIQAAPKQVKTIAMEDYRAVGDHPGDALIIDVRELQEYAAGHVPGAVNIPRGVLEFQIWKHVGSPAGPQMATPPLPAVPKRKPCVSRGAIPRGIRTHAHDRRGHEPEGMAKIRTAIREVREWSFWQEAHVWPGRSCSRIEHFRSLRSVRNRDSARPDPPPHAWSSLAQRDRPRFQ
ncbi:MAG: hypothetical protein DYH03_00945 [Nitrospira sp. NTP1]|nr:hypothetical protein [Nitrospira sp. NTP1]